MSGSSIRSMRLFQNICGDAALKNAIVVLNMWNLVQPETGHEREKELKTKDTFFKPIVDRGTDILHHDNTVESAHAILRQMLKNKPAPLAIQSEMVTQKKALYQTSVGEAMLGELAMLEQNHRREMETLQKEMEEARREQDEVAQAEIQEAQENLEQAAAKIVNERTRLLPADKQKKSSHKIQQSCLGFWKSLGALKCC
ncbi:hypothetical protein EUX98_g2677 [Antrodiella citrinella]|uniref:Uncharacterized protein n=1 Tax=Antrodiella citrinella TaxID=2447956 RepID=A0A4V3XJ32_9APHY|nr:hypothetical protein EUX98_g2677 [Antrodiella citrinella]